MKTILIILLFSFLSFGADKEILIEESSSNLKIWCYDATFNVGEKEVYCYSVEKLDENWCKIKELEPKDGSKTL